MPLDGYRVTHEQKRLLEYAQGRLAVDCLRRFGFAGPEITRRPPMPLGLNERRYGLADLERAEKFGYGVADLSLTDGPAKFDLSPAAAAVWTGQVATADADGQAVPAGGCRAEAQRRLAEGSPAQVDEELADRLSTEAFHRSESDSRVQAAFHEWSACMSKAGYSYADPWVVNNDPKFGQSPPTALEVQIATADVKCKSAVGLVDTWCAVETAYQNRLLEEHHGELTRLKELLDLRIRNATRVVGA
ncbi:MAG: hypothetical protein HOV83_37220 [Catenulispora sp.]|nr:hypothetical protein [Catenulispora sp.]